VEAQCVLADLQDDGLAGPLGTSNDAFGVLECDHVERTQSPPAPVGVRQQFRGCDEWHPTS
jgi:hypothetical protein